MEFVSLAQCTLYYGKQHFHPERNRSRIAGTIFYTLGVEQMEGSEMWESLRDKNLEEEFQLGVARLEKKIALGKQLLQKICLELPAIRSRSMKDTLQSIGTGWRQYDYRFFAHYFPCDIDYQLCHPVPERQKGVDYINEYLRRIWLENDLLRRFDAARVVGLLKSSCSDYYGLLINLYEPVVVNALGLVMTEGDVFELTVCDAQRWKIQLHLLPLCHLERQEEVKKAAEQLCNRLAIRQSTHQAYLARTAEALLPRLEVALKHGDLNHIFLSFGENKKICKKP